MKFKKILSKLSIITIMICLLFSITVNADNKNIEYETAKVVKVVDGDTIEVSVNNKTYKVRFIGVNTPESTIKHEPYGKEASNYTKKMLTGKTVYLQKDVSETDKYGRLLRYVWLSIPKDNTNDKEIKEKMYNANLVLNGYAQVMTVPPDVKYSDKFVEYQKSAREGNKGLWALNTDTQIKENTKKAITLIQNLQVQVRK